MTGGLLTKRALLLAKIETTPGVDANPTPVDNAILVSDPSYTTDPSIIERDYVGPTLSKYEHQIGRVIAGFEFTVDLRSNGKVKSGLVADAPYLATLLRACGYEIVTQTVPAGVLPAKSNLNATVSWAVGGASTRTEPALYTIEVDTAGASGFATATIASNNDASLTGASVTLTSGTAITLGDSGHTITPTFSGDLAVGEQWHVMVFPTGVVAKPKTQHPERVTLYLYLDGNLHKGTNAIGTFSINAEGGEVGTVTFNFTAVYHDAEAVPMPTNAVYLKGSPPQVELALLTWGYNTDMKAGGFTFDAQNTINPRLDVNKKNSYLGSSITDRAPSGGFTPEAQIETDHPFWTEYVNAESKTFTARVGTKHGEQVVIYGPVAQTSEQSYGDRDGFRTYDKTVLFKSGPKGDDEIFFAFC